MMRNCCGPPVEGDNFFGRKKELEQLWRLLERQHILVAAPRRVGKTSIFLKLKKEPQQGWNVIFLNVEACEKPEDFTQEVLSALANLPDDAQWQRELNINLHKFGESLKKVKVGVMEAEFQSQIPAWKKRLEDLFLTVAQEGHKILFIIDEFPIFIQRLSEVSAPAAQDFLHFFRSIRLHPKGLDSLRFILGGSIGLEPLLNRLNLSGTINDLMSYYLFGYSSEEANDFLHHLGHAEDLPLDESVRGEILNLLGDYRIPFYLQLLFSKLRDLVMVEGKLLNTDLVEFAYETLLTPIERKHFDPWDERLSKMFSAVEQNWVRKILSLSCQPPEGLSRSEIENVVRDLQGEDSFDTKHLRNILDALQHDGYLFFNEQNKRYPFCSPLLRDWWKRRYVD